MKRSSLWELPGVNFLLSLPNTPFLFQDKEGILGLKRRWKRKSSVELLSIKYPNKQRKNYSQDLKDAIEEFARRKDKPHVIEEFFCGNFLMNIILFLKELRLMYQRYQR